MCSQHTVKPHVPWLMRCAEEWHVDLHSPPRKTFLTFAFPRGSWAMTKAEASTSIKKPKEPWAPGPCDFLGTQAGCWENSAYTEQPASLETTCSTAGAQQVAFKATQEPWPQRLSLSHHHMLLRSRFLPTPGLTLSGGKFTWGHLYVF